MTGLPKPTGDAEASKQDTRPTMDDDSTDILLSALKNRLRRKVLRSLIEAQSPMSPSELAAYHRIAVGPMSHHIKQLLAVGGVSAPTAFGRLATGAGWVCTGC